MELRIIADDLTRPDVLALLQLHLDEMQRWSPAGHVHAMPAERLREPDVTFFTAWDEDAGAPRLAGCGALKQLNATHGELKSMRVAPEYRGRGVGKAMLARLIDEARARGYTRVSLETGRPAPFHPAQALYRASGFTECASFSTYTPDPFRLCMSRAL